jgi:glyoxylase-like metal-dependent hydrolase (beta-lactamase superfamily II)
MAAQPAPQTSINVGDILITYLPDGEGHMVATATYPASTEEIGQAHPQWLDQDGRVLTMLGGFLIETADRKILVDLGFGDHVFEVPDFARFVGGKYLDSLKQAGATPADIDTVVYTHMHVDHTGWTSSGDGLTFANARHVTGEAEWAHWQEPDPSGVGPNAEAVLAPLASRIEHVSDGEVVAPGVNVMGTPGHTPGHLSLVISSGTDRAVILGDVVNCPVQIAEPEWSVLFDVDPALARRTRDHVLAELEGTATMVADSHFSESVFGRVVPGDGKRLWQVGL